VTKREQEIFKEIQLDPLISQRLLAEKLGIKRSSVAVHLSNLVKKGYLKGKGYIINEQDYICVIGGANIDIVGFPQDKLVFKDSNLGSLQISLGGVGRNIAENLVRLGLNTKLITAIGNDFFGRQIVNSCNEIGIDLKDSLFEKNLNSSVYLAIMDKKNDMALGLDAMRICEALDINFIRKKKVQINNASIIVLDTNLRKDVLEYIVNAHPNKKYFIDTVSGIKAVKVKNMLDKLFMIKANKLEAEVLYGNKIDNKKDLEKAAQFFLKKGIKNVFITLGESGVFYSDKDNSNIVLPSKIKIENTNGAGDAFSAGVIYGYRKSFDINKCAQLGVVCATITIANKDTVSSEMNENIILNELKKYE